MKSKLGVLFCFFAFVENEKKINWIQQVCLRDTVCCSKNPAWLNQYSSTIMSLWYTCWNLPLPLKRCLPWMFARNWLDTSIDSHEWSYYFWFPTCSVCITYYWILEGGCYISREFCCNVKNVIETLLVRSSHRNQLGLLTSVSPM